MSKIKNLYINYVTGNKFKNKSSAKKEIAEQDSMFFNYLFTTNIRTLYGIAKNFINSFDVKDGVHLLKQDISKQWKTKYKNIGWINYYKIENKNFLYSTKRGEISFLSFTKIIKSNFSIEKKEKLVSSMILIELLNSQYENFSTSSFETYFDFLNKLKLDEKEIISFFNASHRLIFNNTKNNINIYLDDVFWIKEFSFYDDLMEAWFQSTKIEKEEFKLFAIKSYKKGWLGNFKKYKPGDIMSKTTWYEDLHLMYSYHRLYNSNFETINEFVEIIKILFELRDDDDAKEYLENFAIDIWIDLHNLMLKVTNGNDEDYMIEDTAMEPLDKTSPEKKEIIKYFNYTSLDRGKFRKESTKFRKTHKNSDCFFKESFKCTTFLKNNNKKYLEVHHLILHSKKLEFDNSIEVFSNYSLLCPTCHRRIHYGSDNNEMIKQIYEYNKDQLRKDGILISYEELVKFYNLKTS